MNNYRKYFSLIGLVLFAFTLFTACEEDDSPGEEAKRKVQVASNSAFGSILVNQENQSLYFFAGDVTGVSNCNGGCADVWPPLIGEVYELEFGSGLNNANFSTITREDGQKQITFKGWPLYYFSPEGDGVQEAPGEVLGDGRGGVFHVAKPDYTVLVGRQSVTEGQEAVVYLVDDRGVSLYRSINDGENVSNCADGCAEVWPPFKASENWVIPSSLSAVDFSSFSREDGLGPQLSYQGSPLYYFTPDEEIRGNVLGQGGAGETFFVVEPAQ
uniref:Lipoprotein n=1 Tax=Roseihalotalea indica TaxID=2867963 RepID=A0AA49GKU4_9BACT|nr:hypothetical protein K4G66_16775 [Tunicatimonas sp. TK19036]